MDLKQSLYLEVERNGNVYQLYFTPDTTNGELFDVTYAMMEQAYGLLQKAHENAETVRDTVSNAEADSDDSAKTCGSCSHCDHEPDGGF